MNLEFNSEQRMFLKQAFAFFSSNEQYMSHIDINRLLRAIGKYLEPINLVNLMQQVSDRKDGKINFYEFLTLLKIIIEGQKQAQLKKLYLKFDKDGNGSLSVSQLKQIMQKSQYSLTPQQIDILLEENTIQDIPFQKFCKMVFTNLPPTSQERTFFRVDPSL